jgi:hypothetical protein
MRQTAQNQKIPAGALATVGFSMEYGLFSIVKTDQFW